MKKDSVYVQHILDALARIQRYTQSVSHDFFLKESLVQDGVIRQLEIVGEAARQLSDTFCSRHHHIPWQDIAGMRDKLIHGYFGVDLETVWRTVQEDVPKLQQDIRVLGDV